MAGGAGTRFWPASRADQPKQLLSLTGGPTMIQSTVSRLGSSVPPENVRVLTNERLVDKIREQLPDVPSESIIGEPCKRDTAPCIGLAAALVAASDPDGTMIVMPSDHVIRSDEQFQQAIQFAADLVEEDPSRVITFGIKPNYPATVFGYIERGGELETSSGEHAFLVERFREKPDLETAKNFVDSGNFYWNSGIFVWKARTILDALRRFEPEMAAHIDQIAAAIGDDSFEAVLAREFEAIEGKSIDFAVMERYEPVCVIEAPFEWNDVGNWTALEGLVGQDEEQNTLVGNQLTINSSNCIVRNENAGDHLVALVGMKNCIVVRTDDATIVVDKESEADVKQIVAQLESKGWSQYL